MLEAEASSPSHLRVLEPSKIHLMPYGIVVIKRIPFKFSSRGYRPPESKVSMTFHARL